MLCFNYIANIIKLMGLLSREGMRDGNIGICWDAGHIGICGICGEDGGYAEICGICGTDHHPEIGPAGLPFLVPPPPDLRRSGNENGKRPANRKKECLFCI
jgi:hypothetical protein